MRVLNTKSVVFLIVSCTFGIGLALVIALRYTEHARSGHYSEQVASQEAGFRVQIIAAPTHGYGYNILLNGRILIHQSHMPAVSGIEAFHSEEDARTVAQFVVGKIRRNMFPPSVTHEELDSLGVVH